MVTGLDSKRIYNKRVLLRVDLNLPMLNGEILSMARWKNVLPTIKTILAFKPSKLVIVSHLGQPKGFDDAFSLSHIHKKIIKDVPGLALIASIKEMDQEGILFLLENVRFDAREKIADETLVDEYLSNIDTVVFDAFSVGHRNHASVCGIITHAKSYVFGSLFMQEMHAINIALEKSGKRVAILSGAKIATKLPILNKMLNWADHVLVGGGIANTLLQAQGIQMKKSLIDFGALHEAESLLGFRDKLVLPVDGINQQGKQVDFNQNDMHENDAILDIGPKTCALYANFIDLADTIIWNGPMGYYEDPSFQKGTQAVALAIAESSAYTLVGGGDSVAAIEDLNIGQGFDYVSTSGGAFLHYIANGTLPVLDATQLNKHQTLEVIE